MKKVIIYLFMSFLCSSSFLYGQGNIDQVKSKIKQMNEQWANYNKTGNYQALLDFFVDSAFVMPANHKMFRGKDAFKQYFEERQKNIERFINQEFNTVDVFGENNLFVEIGTSKSTIQMKNMSNPVQDEGKYVTVWKMMPDGSLKIVADIGNSNKSLKEVQSAGMNEENKEDEVTGGKEKK